MASKTYYYGLGRRKSATARARLYSKGKGNVVINEQPLEEYIENNERLAWELKQPLTLLSKDDDYDVHLKVDGGGIHGQIDAGKLAISNALASIDDDVRSTLKKAGFLKRDPREKERKKYGLKRARKAEQYTKR